MFERDRTTGCRNVGRPRIAGGDLVERCFEGQPASPFVVLWENNEQLVIELVIKNVLDLLFQTRGVEDAIITIARASRVKFWTAD